MTTIPEHMREGAEFFRSDTYSGFSPEYYEESSCQNCGKPVYKYLMDVIVEWKHFDHSRHCYSWVAMPTELS